MVDQLVSDFKSDQKRSFSTELAKFVPKHTGLGWLLFVAVRDIYTAFPTFSFPPYRPYGYRRFLPQGDGCDSYR